MKYRQVAPPTCEAVQWFRNGDHPKDGSVSMPGGKGLTEGKVVRYYRHPDYPGETLCNKCGAKLHDHGWIENGGEGFVVCPGDYILFTDFHYPLDPKTFLASYAPLVTGDAEADLIETRIELQQCLDSLRARNKGATEHTEQRHAAAYKVREAIHWLSDALASFKK